MNAFNVSASQDKGYQAGNSVSATRIDTAIKDLPFAVSAFTEQFISDLGTRELGDVLKYAPSVTSGSDGFSSGNAFIMVRGFQSVPQRNGVYSPLYVDGSILQRVEVVKGPASLFYGQLAPGGVVNYITKRAEARNFGSLSVQAGSYSYARTQLDVNQAMISDKVFLRLNTAWENLEQYVDKVKGEQLVIAPSLLIKVTPNSTLNIDYQSYKRDETPQALMRQSILIPLNNATYFPNPAKAGSALYSFTYVGHYAIKDRKYNATSIYDYKNTDVQTLTADYTIRLNKDWNTRIVYDWDKSMQKMKQTGRGDVTVIIPASFLNGVATDFSSVTQYLNDHLNMDTLPSFATGSQVVRRMRFEQNYTQRRTLLAETAGKVQLGEMVWKPLVGYQYNTGTTQLFQSQLPTAQWQPAWNLFDRSTWVDVDSAVSTWPTTNNAWGNFENLGAYSANQLSFFKEKLILVGGLRWSQNKSTGYNKANNTVNPSYKTTRSTPQLGAGYRLTKDLMLYGSYSESFTASNTLLSTAGVVDRVAEPFLGSGYEAGLKADFLDGRISGTLACFKNEQKNYIFDYVTVTSDGQTAHTSIQNGNVVSSKGVELELTYSPTDNWQVYFAASSAPTEYTSIKSPDFMYLLHTAPQYTARDRANLWTRYSFKEGAAKGLWIAGGFNYTGKKAEISNNPWLYLPAQTVADAVVGYDWKAGSRNWSAKLSLKNITNVDEILTVRERGQPRRLVAELGVRF
jgi:iron complex outermembrane receptor protein